MVLNGNSVHMGRDTIKPGYKKSLGLIYIRVKAKTKATSLPMGLKIIQFDIHICLL